MLRVTTEAFDADPEALTQLAGRTMDAVDTTTDAIIRMVADVQLAPGDLGPTSSGATMHDAAARASEAANAAVGAIAEVWELDADSLIQTAVAYRETDLDEAARLRTPRMEPR